MIKAKGSRNFSSKASIPSGIKKLEQLILDNKNDLFLVNNRLVELLKDPEFLMFVYANIKSKTGNSTRVTDNLILDGIDYEWFYKTAEDLGSGRFMFKPVKQIKITKSNSGVKILGVTSTRDKIILNAIKIILEAIFEPTFSDNSHGFRPGKSRHTALKQIKLTFGGTIWFIEGDISKCFDTIDQKILLEFVKVKIKDQVFIDLIYKAIKVGYIDIEGNFRKLKARPQGSFLSPILCNIYLDRLDK